MLATILNEITALAFVVVIDVVLAGDNAIVVGLAVAGLAAERRRRAIVTGIGAAAVLRVLFAFVALQLLDVIGLAFAGGVLLLWVAWKLYREVRQSESAGLAGYRGGPPPRQKTMRQAVTQIVIADLSMSLDNVLAVAGVARTQAAPWLGVAIVAVVALRMIWAGADVVVIHFHRIL
jgi:YjbE family integral membrane protein